MYVTITGKEILELPNDLELGKFVREKYWKTSDEIIGNNPDEHIQLEINEDGLVIGLSKSSDDEYDSCVSCGRKTKYLKNTHIDLRLGYIDGAGQTCDGSCRK